MIFTCFIKCLHYYTWCKVISAPYFVKFLSALSNNKYTYGLLVSLLCVWKPTMQEKSDYELLKPA
jgi:hypothetical protein